MRPWIALFAAAGVVAATLPFIRQHDDKLLALLGKAKVAVAGSADAKRSKPVDPPPLVDVDLTDMDDRREVVTAPAHGHRNADLTINPIYQRAASGLLRDGKVYEGAVVLVEVKTGKILVWSSVNQGRRRDLVVEATAPSASVFKIVTGAALIEANVPMNEKVCYSGGEQRITKRDLEPDPDRDKYCASLPMAMGRSLNTVFARLALQRLDADKIEGAAHRLGWGVDVPFDVPVAQSTIALPRDDQLEFARAAAGFWHTTLSPFQAANLALTVANKGEMVKMHVVERVVDDDGQEIYRRPAEREVLRRALDERTAWAVARMMEQTVRNGSSFNAFHDRSGRPYLPDIRIAGKTGTLEASSTRTLYTWFVGFAPSREPELAIAVLVANRGEWHVKASEVASNLLRVVLADQGAPNVTYPVGYNGPKRKPPTRDDDKSDKPKSDVTPAAAASSPLLPSEHPDDTMPDGD
jgi:peptidoglycan glycosyltransferase